MIKVVGGYALGLWWSKCQDHQRKCTNKDCVLCHDFTWFKRIHDIADDAQAV